MIKLENVYKAYNKGKANEQTVIDHTTLEFPEKGLVVLFGESGSGKTTLLNVIGGLDKPDSGTIYFNDISIPRYKSNTWDKIRNKYIGYIFQNYNLLEGETVYDNIKISLQMAGLDSPEEISDRIDYALKLVGLEKYRKRDVSALSGGEQQRVAIARAISKNPRIIIADEPTGNLDSNNTFQIMSIIRKIAEERLVILVTHEKEIVDFYGDRIIQIKDGKVVSDEINTKTSGYGKKDERVVYLGDLSKKEIEQDNLSLRIFNQEEQDNLKIDILFKNGKVYIKQLTNNKIELVDEDSEVVFNEGHYQEVSQEDVEVDFDLDRLKEIDNTSKKPFVNFFTSIKDGFNKINRKNKKQKFLRLGLFVVAFMFAFNLGLLLSSINVKPSDYQTVAKNMVVVNLTYYEEQELLQSDVEKILNYPEVKYVSLFNYVLNNNFSVSIEKNKQVSYNKTIRAYPVISDYYKINKLICGSKDIQNNEVIIDKMIADTILKDKILTALGITEYSDLLDFELSDGSIIKGIVDHQEPVIVLSQKSYNDFFEGIYFSEYNADVLYTNIINQGRINLYTDNISSLKEKLKTDYNFTYISDTNKDLKDSYVKEILAARIRRIVFPFVVLIALTIYIMILMRSSLISRIREIGVLRTVGCTKKDVYKIFAGEIIALVTSSTIIGMIASKFLMIFIDGFVGGIADAFDYQISLFYFPIWIGILSLLFLYAVYVLFGLIPVFSLLRKTPSEIIKKYDI